jgi:hypothetical protein
MPFDQREIVDMEAWYAEFLDRLKELSVFISMKFA